MSLRVHFGVWSPASNRKEFTIVGGCTGSSGPWWAPKNLTESHAISGCDRLVLLDPETGIIEIRTAEGVLSRSEPLGHMIVTGEVAL